MSSSYALLYALTLAAGVAGMGMGKNILRDKLHRVEETRDALKKKMLDDISAELGRMGSGSQGYENLREEFEKLRGSLGLRSDDPALSASLEELNVLKGKARAAEVDEKQCRHRSEAVLRSLEAIRALNVASYSEELERLEGEFEKISALPPEERLFQLQGMAGQLQKMEKLAAAASEVDVETLREHRYVFEATSEKNKEQDKNTSLQMIREIRDWADRIVQLDETEGEKLRPLLENLKADTAFPDRLTRLHRQMKTAWGALRERAASTEFFRDKLGELLDLLQASQDAFLSPEGSALDRRRQTLQGGKFIDRELFITLYEDIARFVWSRGEEIADAVFAQRVERTLSEMGYDLVPENKEAAEAKKEVKDILRPEQVRYLESPYEGYRVMVKVDAKEGVAARLVRAVATEEEKEREQNAPSANQLQKDREVGQKWCRDFDGFLAKMREQDLPLNVSLRQEPEESQVLIVVDESLSKSQRAGGAQRKRRKSRGTQALQEQTLGGGGA
jgi:hypothetical protein